MKRYIRSSEVYDSASKYTPYVIYNFDKRYFKRIRDFLPKSNLLDYDMSLQNGTIKILVGDKQRFENFIDDYGFDFIEFAGYSR